MKAIYTAPDEVHISVADVAEHIHAITGRRPSLIVSSSNRSVIEKLIRKAKINDFSPSMMVTTFGVIDMIDCTIDSMRDKTKRASAIEKLQPLRDLMRSGCDDCTYEEYIEKIEQFETRTKE